METTTTAEKKTKNILFKSQMNRKRPYPDDLLISNLNCNINDTKESMYVYFNNIL